MPENLDPGNSVLYASAIADISRAVDASRLGGDASIRNEND